MNSVTNSDSEQCTESKIGLGAQTLAARTVLPGRPCRGPCCSLWPAMSQAWPAVSQAWPAVSQAWPAVSQAWPAVSQAWPAVS